VSHHPGATTERRLRMTKHIPLCSIPGCPKKMGANQLCQMHRARLRRTGTTDPQVTSHINAEERFNLGVVKVSDGCWLWSGEPSSTGYVHLSLGGRRKMLGHRWAYEHFKGPIPDGLHIDHLCKVRSCLNPDHLEAVTQAENNRRAWVVRRANASLRSPRSGGPSA
jgi:hypothetical protein